MGFFDTYEQAPGGLEYVKGPEKDVLIANGVALPVLQVWEGPGFKGEGKQYSFRTEIEGEERAISYGIGTVFTRDAMFAQLKDYLATKDSDPDFETPVIKLVRSGKSVILVDANS